jgi:murein DD-endopeptidase
MMRRVRSLGDLALAALCLWAAWYHTPPGALVRTALAGLLGMRGAAPPILSYYGAGARSPRPLPEAPPPRAPLAPDAALALGVQAALGELPQSERADLLARSGVRAPTAEAIGAHLAREVERHGSRDAAVLALLCGEEAARFARERSRAEGAGGSLEELARHLPPRYAERVALASTALALGTAYALAWPLSDSAQVTSMFGAREHPLLGAQRMHTGVDLAIPLGTPVRAAGDGIVRRASSDEVSGRLLLVDHGSGVSTVYGHNDALLVSRGDRVVRGQVIARSGNSGLSTGPHLHYQLELPQGPVDPFRFRAGRPPPVALGGTEP